MKGASWRILKFLSPANVKISAQSADIVPLKHMEFHVVNSSALLNSAVALIFPFLGQRLKDQIHFHHSNMKSLNEFLGKESLPEEYGGVKGSKLECDMLYKQLSTYYNTPVSYGKSCHSKNLMFEEMEKENLVKKNSVKKI